MPPKARPKKPGYPTIITTRRQAQVQTDKALQRQQIIMAAELVERIEQGFGDLQEAQTQNTQALQNTIQQTLNGLLGPQLPPGNPPRPPVLLQTVNNNIHQMNQRLAQAPDPGIDSLCLQPFKNQPQDNPRQFLEDFNAYCQYRTFTPARKVQLFQLLLKGTPKLWFQGLEDAIKHNWEQLSAAFTAEYVHEPTMLDQTLTDLIMHQPNQNVVDYYNLIVAACKKVNRNDQQTRDTFIRNLDKPIKLFVLSRQPATLAEALQFARLAQNLLVTNTLQEKSTDPSLQSTVMATTLASQVASATPNYIPGDLFPVGSTERVVLPATTVAQPATQTVATSQQDSAKTQDDKKFFRDFKNSILASISSGNGNGKSRNQLNLPNKPLVCFYCHKMGHSWKICRSLPRGSQQFFANRAPRPFFPNQFRQNFNNQGYRQQFNQFQRYNRNPNFYQNNQGFRPRFSGNYQNQQNTQSFPTQNYNNYRTPQSQVPQGSQAPQQQSRQNNRPNGQHPGNSNPRQNRSQVHFADQPEYLNC